MCRRKLLGCLLAMSACTTPGAAAGAAPAAGLGADELAFLKEETLVAATGFAQPTFEASSNVFVVTRKDIERMNPKSLGDIFRLVPGLAVHFTNDTYFNLAAGGVGARFSNLLLVQLDGAPVIDALYGETPWNLLPVSPEDIERIEVVVGPATSLYGENAFTGVVDIITRKPAREVAVGGSATLAAGDGFGRLSVRGASRGARSVLEARAGYQPSEGPRYRSTMGFPNPDLPRGSTDADPVWADVSWRLDLDKYRQLGLEVSHSFQDLGSISDFSGVPTQGSARMTMAVGRYREQVNPDQELRVRLQYNDQDWSAFTANGAALGELDLPTSQRLLDLDASKSVDVRKLRSLFGVSWRQRQAEGNLMLPGSHDYGTRSAYYQAEYEVDRRWAVFGSTRYVDADVTGGDAAFKLDLRRRVSAREVVRLGAGRAFRTPDLVTLYLAPVTEVGGVSFAPLFILAGNADLENEQTESAQLGYERRSTRSTLKVDLFRQRSWDLIAPLSTGVSVGPYTQHRMGNLSDELTAVGVTCHWENRLSERFTLVLNGTLQDAEFAGGTRQAGYAPRELYNLDLRFFPVRGQQFDLLLTHQSSVWPLQYGYDPFLAGEVPGYDRVDVTWRRDLPRGALAVTVRNLFDDGVLGVTRGQPQYAPELGRELFVSYTVKF